MEAFINSWDYLGVEKKNLIFQTCIFSESTLPDSAKHFFEHTCHTTEEFIRQWQLDLQSFGTAGITALYLNARHGTLVIGSSCRRISIGYRAWEMTVTLDVM